MIIPGYHLVILKAKVYIMKLRVYNLGRSVGRRSWTARGSWWWKRTSSSPPSFCCFLFLLSSGHWLKVILLFAFLAVLAHSYGSTRHWLKVTTHSERLGKVVVKEKITKVVYYWCFILLQMLQCYFKNSRKKFTSCRKKDQALYQSEKNSLCKSDIRETWELVRKVSCTKPRQFQQFFADTGPNLAHKVPKS